MTEPLEIDLGNLNRDANFISFSFANIKTILSEVSNTDLGDKKLKDPWWVDQNGNQPGDFRSISSANVGVFLNQFIESDKPYYSVSVQSPQTIHLTQTNKDHKFYFQNWSATPSSDAEFQNANAAQTAVVFKNDNVTVKANLKGTQLSNNANTYANNSQRKFVRSDDGVLHSVYESLGRVWYETSTNNGTTWKIENGGKPLDSGAGKNPSIDYCTFTDQEEYNQIFIVYQEQYGSTSKVKVKYFQSIEGSSYSYRYQSDVATVSGSYSSINTTPVVCAYEGQITIIWKNGTSYLYGRNGYVNVFNGIYLYSANSLTGTTSNSINPTINCSKTCCTWVKKLAWEELGSGNSSSIKYASLVGSQISGSIETVSSGNGYSTNTKPTIAFYDTNNSPVIAWIIKEPVTYQLKAQLRIKYDGSRWSQFWIWYYGGGDDINSVSINNDYNGKFVLAWGGDDQNNQYLTSHSTTAIYNLNTLGDVQVSNAGTTMGDMKIMSFDKWSSVHDFTANAVTQGLYKEKNRDEIIASKGLVVTSIQNKDTSLFMFDLGGIEVDGAGIFFNDSFEELDSILKENTIESESFMLTNNSIFNFTTDYYSKVNKSTNTSSVKFKINLVDAESGKVIDLLKEENKNNTFYKSLGYSVNVKDIGNKKVKLKLEFESDENVISTVYNSIVRDSIGLNKQKYQQISLRLPEMIKEYSLAQNYPNPFNPITTINYQIPKDGFVTLKIYDVLGKEAATLVNENKPTGRYNIEFNAGNLASGVYLYQLKVNDFVSTKKLVLLK